MSRVTLRRLALLTASLIGLGASGLVYLQPRPPAFSWPHTATRSASPTPSRINQPVSGRLQALQPLSDTEALAWVIETGGANRLYATRQQGATWTAVPLPDLGSQKFGFQALDLDHIALLLGRGLKVTRNAGARWESASLPPGHSFGLGTWFIDQQAAWYLDLGAYPGQSAQPSSMWWTGDGATTWRELWQVDAQHPSAGAIPLAGTKIVLGFRDRQNGWLSITNPGGPARLLRTKDGGRTWSNVMLPVAATTFEGIRFPADGSAILFGRAADGNFALASDDGGDTWNAPVPLPSEEAGRGRGPSQAAFADRSHWLAAAGLTLYVTSDGGHHWTARKASVPPSISAIHDLWFWADQGWATATNQYGGDVVLITTDGGHRWRSAGVPSLGGD